MLYCEYSKYSGACDDCIQYYQCGTHKHPNQKGETENVRRNERNNRRNSDGKVQGTDQVGQAGPEGNQPYREDLQRAPGSEGNGTVLSAMETGRTEKTAPGSGCNSCEDGRRVDDQPCAITQLDSYAMRLAFHKFKFDVLVMESQGIFTENGMGGDLMDKMAQYIKKMKENYE